MVTKTKTKTLKKGGSNTKIIINKKNDAYGCEGTISCFKMFLYNLVQLLNFGYLAELGIF
jgi:hypothetical protein